ncbi:MT-A70 family protein [Marine Group I thaumarchaeote SCGC RSA3]|uniref:MT-A70 family protein n=1 Tax=Marine Group I thaumarchaeote SCGC RSA3 TaxID=1503183 RepID=A0A087RXJ1_9ARCH|nr:MT-A70 family protein [Marine Group I thaumarchaeote SCGC RSA3]
MSKSIGVSTTTFERAKKVIELASPKLKESIKKDGQWTPITINQDGVILDGHHRYRICNELSITPKTITKTFQNKLLEEKFVIESNLLRRHLNDKKRN